ncbi:MAG: N-acetylneuraminate synthase [Candidatus Margulisiibacteriota bacterium]
MNKIFIIAEAGVNHNGDLSIAKKMVDAAKSAGADAVKFQSFVPEEMVSPLAEKAEYQKAAAGETESHLEMLKKLALDHAGQKELYDYCISAGIKFLSSPFDLPSIDFLNRLGLDTFKIPSGEITNLPYLRKIGALKKKLIMSTGMATLREVGAALEVLTGAGMDKKAIVLLHCNTAYPTPVEDVNLNAILILKRKFGVEVGYSDHTLGREVCLAAVAIGAVVIEKHFTLDRTMAGPDHRASLEPLDFKKLVISIRNVSLAMGSGVKEPSKSEIKNIAVVRKSIFASQNIYRGEVITEKMLVVKRPAIGLSPMEWDALVGRVAGRDYKAGEIINSVET